MARKACRFALIHVLLCLVFTPFAAFSQADRAGCRAEPSLEPLLEQVGGLTELFELSAEAWRERLDLVERALEEHPDDLFLHRLRQDLYRAAPKAQRGELQERLRAEYEVLRDSRPGDPRFHYLLARVAGDPDVERKASVAAIETDDSFAWGHLSMVASILRGVDGPLGAAQQRDAQEHLARFMELCPNQPYGALIYGDRVGDGAFWESRIPEIRRRLRAEPGSWPRAFSRLWALEFRLTAVAEHGAVRERIAGDAARLGALDAERRAVLEVLKEGYTLAGMTAEAAATEARLREAAPCSRDSVLAVLGEWSDSKVVSSVGVSEGESPTDPRAFEQATREWIATCPDEYLFWIARLRALDQLEGSDSVEIVATGERAAELYGQFRGFVSPSGFMVVAEILLDRRLDLDRVGELLDRAETEAESREADTDLEQLPEALRREIEQGRAYAAVERLLLRARCAAALESFDLARDLVGEVGDRLDELDPGDGGSGRERLVHNGYRSALWEARAELAEAEGRLPDAVAHLLRAEAVGPSKGPGRGPGPAEGEARRRALELWVGLGGTEEGLAALESTAASEVGGESALADYSPWEAADGPLPTFELTDVTGAVWKSEDLEGKVVVASAWATWCGPCHQELRAVQLLHERLRDRDDVLVLTLNMDDNLGKVAPYLADKGFTFPVLLATDYLRRELGVVAIPHTWIVDPTLTRRFEQRGYDGGTKEESWIADVEERLRVLAGQDVSAQVER